MTHPLITRLRNHPDAGVYLILASAIVAFAANISCLMIGITIVVSHLLYIPIILAAFFFPKRGIPVAIVIAAGYFMMVVVFRAGFTADLLSAGVRCMVFIFIAVVVSYLSEQVNLREISLKKARDEWERTFNAVPDLIALISREHRIIRINRAMAQSLGITPDQAVGKHCYEIVHKTSAPPSFCPHARLLKDGHEHSCEVREENLGGNFLITTSPLSGADGDLIGSVHVARDITRRKKAEDALREKTEELDRFFSVNLDMLCIADTDGRFHRVNVAWERTLGYTRDELMSYRFTDLVHPDDLQKTREAVAVLAGQKEVAGFVNRYRCRDGSYRWIEWRSFPYGDLIYAAARDITDRIQAEQATVQANKKLNILSSITRHDILNKITALYAYLDISRDVCTTQSQCEHIDKEIEIIQALQRQVEFTKYYQDIGVREPLWHDVGDVFRTAVSQISLPTITIDVACDSMLVFADPLIEKVFYNLIENSIRHGEHVTAIRLSAQKTGTGYSLLYEDNGVGVPDEIKGKLFQRGFGKHTGFGLFLSREILAITGITITENGEPGKGVRFEIAVPAEAVRIRKDEQSGRS